MTAATQTRAGRPPGNWWDDIDPVAVERALRGDEVRLTLAERLEAVRILTEPPHRLSMAATGERLHMAARTVGRYRRRLRSADAAQDNRSQT